MVAALLHDVLDDTEVEAGAVATLFGEQVGGAAAGGGRPGSCAQAGLMAVASHHESPTPPARPLLTPCTHLHTIPLQVYSMVSTVSRLSTTNQIVRRRLRVESAQPTKEEENQLR